MTPQPYERECSPTKAGLSKLSRLASSARHRFSQASRQFSWISHFHPLSPLPMASHLQPCNQSVVDHQGFGLRLFYATGLLSVMAVGCPGNILVILSVIMDRKLRKVENLPIACLSGIDFCILLSNVLPTVINAISDRCYVGMKVCIFQGFLGIISCALSIGVIAIISVSRYFAVCRVDVYKRWITVKSIVAILVAFVISLFALYGTLCGIPTPDDPYYKFVYNSNSASCLNIMPYEVSFVLAAVFLAIPMGLTTFSYWRIYAEIKRRAKNVLELVDSRKQSEDYRLLKMLIVTFLAFIIPWLPFGTILVLQIYFAPMEKVLWLLAMASSAVNPIIYAIFNSNFRRAYRRVLLRCITTNRVEESSMTSQSATTRGN